MSVKTQSRLGKGIEALIPRSSFTSGRTLTALPIQSIVLSPYQPRKTFDESAISGLADSIKNHGLAQPIVVRKKEDHYELVAGERRLRASEKAGLRSIPAIIRDLSDKEAMQIALIENLQRENLNPIEIASGYQRLITEFELTHQDLADMFTKSRSAITNTLRLLSLPTEIKNAVQSLTLSEGHARTLAAIDSPQQQLEMFHHILTKKLSVRQAEAMLRDLKPKSKKQPSPTPQHLKDRVDHLQNTLKMGIDIKGSQQKGQITLKYKTPEDLDPDS